MIFSNWHVTIRIGEIHKLLALYQLTFILTTKERLL